MADFDIFNLQPSVISRDLTGKYILLYGKPKVGKTSFAVQSSRCLVCAFELGVNALAGTRYIPMDKWSTFKKLMGQLRKPQAKELYDTIVIDTVSIAFDLCEKYIVQREGVDSIRDIPWGQGWNMVKNEFQECLRELTMLGFGLILICHSKEKATDQKDEEGNAITTVEPDLSKNAYTICNAICDIIGYINVEFEKNSKGQIESKRYLYTRQTPTIFAGSRYQYLAEKIPFGYDELVEAVGQALDTASKNDGATVVDHMEKKTVATRSFDDIMAEAKKLWIDYMNKAQDDEDANHRADILNDIVLKIFGKPIKISTAVPSQADLVELVIDQMKLL